MSAELNNKDGWARGYLGDLTRDSCTRGVERGFID